METLVNKGVEYTYNQKEINNIVNDTVDSINEYVKSKNYQVPGKIQYYNFKYINLSKRQMKKIQKYCFWIKRSPSIRRINTFYGILSRFYDVDRIKVNVSLKEQKIQNARKEWLVVRNESDRLLAKYKKEKSDFYKR